MYRRTLIVGLLLLPRLVLAQSNEVDVYDTTTNTLIGAIHSPYSFDVRISPDGSFGFVTNQTPSVLLFDATTDQDIGWIPLSYESAGVALTPDSRYAYVANPFSLNGPVSVIDVVQQAVINIIPSVYAWYIAMSPVAPRAYGGPSVIDTETQRVVGMLPGGEFMAVSPDGAELYVAGDNLIAVFSTADDTLLATIDVPGGGSGGEIVFSPDGTAAYSTGTDLVVAIDTAMRSVTAGVFLPGRTRRLAITPDGSRLYHLGEQAVEVISTKDLSVLTTIPYQVTNPATSVTISPDGQKAYVAFTCVGLC